MREQYAPSPEDMVMGGQKIKPEEREEEIIEEGGYIGEFGGFYFTAKVKIGQNNEVTFLDDIDEATPALMDERDIKILLDAGILKKEQNNDARSYYDLASDGYSGHVFVAKEDINDAIKSGRLHAEFDEDNGLTLKAGKLSK